jgi:hypothetical protein
VPKIQIIHIPFRIEGFTSKSALVYLGKKAKDHLPEKE